MARLQFLVQYLLLAFAFGKPEKRFKCPNELRCTCNFNGRAINCYNTSVIPEIPEWAERVYMDTGHTLSWSRPFPKNIYVLGVRRYKEVSLKGSHFEANSNLRKLTLWHNDRTTLSQDTFKNIRKIQVISISSTGLGSLEPGLFRGLRLTDLTLWDLRILQRELVDNLCSLNVAGLKKLQMVNISLSSIPEALARCISTLTFINLSRNNFSDPKSLASLTSLSNLRSVLLASSNITSSETLKFLKGKNITRIQIENNFLSRSHIQQVLCFLPPSTLKQVDISGHAISFLNHQFFKCLSGTKMSSLIMQGANITLIDRETFGNFSGSFELVLSKNRIRSDGLEFLLKARSVTRLILERNGLTTFPEFKKNGKCMNLHSLLTISLASNDIFTISQQQTECLGYVRSLQLTSNKIVFLRRNTFYNMTRLRRLYLDGNGLLLLERMSLPMNLWLLDLTRNTLKHGFKEGIRDLTRLQELRLSGTDSIVPKAFSRLDALQILYLNDCRIAKELINVILKMLPNLRLLYLIKMNLRRIPTEVCALQHLEYLAVYSNRIAGISAETLAKLKRLKYFSITDNPFECNCSLLEVTKWFRDPQRQTNIGSPEHTNCFSPATLRGEPLMFLDIDCRNLLPIILPSVLVPVLFLIIVVTVVSIRYRGYIRYGCMLVKARWRGYGAIEGRSFRWDAFVSYNREDAEWVLRMLRPKLEEEAGYQLCLHDRDFTIGDYIVDNIINCIDLSRKTILILSDNFAKSQWCQLEMNLAQHKLFEEDRDVLILVRRGEIAEEHFTNTMRLLMRTKTYITWPEEEEGRSLFWKNLILALKRPPGIVMEHPEEWPEERPIGD